MKTLKLVIFIMLFVGVNTSSKAQVSFNIHIGTPPQWAPQGCADARYYYLPDVESYYDVHSSMFIYFYGGRWVHRHHLPARYRNYDLYNGYKVVMSDYRGDRPYSHFREHREKYARGYRGHERPEYRDRREMNRYEDHSPRHERDEYRDNYGDNHHHRGNGNNGNGRGNGKHDKHDRR